MTEEQQRQILERLEFISGQLHAMAAMKLVQINYSPALEGPISEAEWASYVERCRPREGYEGEYKAAYNLMMNLGGS